MALVIQKFGGTSVANIDRIKHVAGLIAKTRQAGDTVVVVVSAMSGETDRLVKLAHAIAEFPDEREMDMLLSTGERVTIALLAMALRAMGFDARSFTGRQVGIITDNTHTKARIERIVADRIQAALDKGIIPVVAGFQGISEQDDVTTLGRGGSDLTAVALAAALKADRCLIHTYEEMLELASLGAKVLQSRSVEFAAKYEIPVVVKSTFVEGSGTLVTKEDRDMEQVVVSGVTGDRNQAKVTFIGVPDRPGIAARMFGPLGQANILVDMIIQNVGQGDLTDLSFTIPRADVHKAVDLSNRIAKDIGARSVEVKDQIAKVSLVGVGMRSHSGVAARMFETLARERINIMMISTSEIKISCVIEEKYLDLAIRALHEAFGPGKG